MKKEAKVRVPCAYTTERVAQIREAIRAWYQALPAPRNLTAGKRVDASPRTISIYVSAKERSQCGPNPKIMAKLFQETGNPVFQLSEKEKAIFRARGYEVPEDGVVGEALKVRLGLKRPENIVGPMSGEKGACPVEPKPDDPSALSVFAFPGAAQKLLMAMSVNLSVIGDLMPKHHVRTWYPEARAKAAELVKKIIQTFCLEPEDFRPKRAASEPALGEKMDKVLNTVFGKPE